MFDKSFSGLGYYAIFNALFMSAAAERKRETPAERAKRLEEKAERDQIYYENRIRRAGKRAIRMALGRNDKCICNDANGRKVKHCCGSGVE